MGCGASARRDSNAQAKYQDETSEDNGEKSAMSARERILYNRPPSEDGEVTDEPSSLVTTVTRSWRQFKARWSDKPEDGDVDPETLSPQHQPSHKLAQKTMSWMDEIERVKKGLPPAIRKTANGAPVTPPPGEAAPLECYIDVVLHDNTGEDDEDSIKGPAGSSIAGFSSQLSQSLKSLNSFTMPNYFVFRKKTPMAQTPTNSGLAPEASFDVEDFY